VTQIEIEKIFYRTLEYISSLLNTDIYRRTYEPCRSYRNHFTHRLLYKLTSTYDKLSKELREIRVKCVAPASSLPIAA